MGRVRRALVVAVPVATALAGLTGLEAWPLTGWRLFSQRRGRVEERLEAWVARPDGSEEPVPFARLPRGFAGSVAVLGEMARQRPEERDPACRAWAVATERLDGRPVARVVVRRVRRDVLTGAATSEAAWTCGERR